MALKEVSVVGASEGNGGYEVCLDHRKVRTPARALLTIPSRTLANAIAKEWDMQREQIHVGRMHLFGLAATSIDNPNGLTSESIVERLVDTLLPSDTILYYDENERLRERQEAVWGRFLDWARETHDLDLAPSTSMAPPTIPPDTKDRLRSHLAAYNFWALNGYVFGAEAVKSVLLMWGTVNGHFSVEDAVSASLLELDFQKERWGNVEWAHDLELHELRSRLAAAALFVQLNAAPEPTSKAVRAAA